MTVTPCPADLSDMWLRSLVADWYMHLGGLVDAEHGIGNPAPASQLRGDALHVLAAGQAIVDQVQATRWATLIDALTYGATIGDVATAMGLDNDEIVVGLRSWVDGQTQAGRITPAERDDLLTLVAATDSQS